MKKKALWSGRILALIIRLGLGFVFITAGLAKVGDPQTFVRAVRAYDILPEWGVYAFGYGLAPLEIILGILLILGFVIKPVAGSLAFLLTIFNIAIASVWIRGINVECGCFGGGGLVEGTFDATAKYLPHLLTNFGYIAAAIYIVLMSPRISKFFTVDAALDKVLMRKDKDELING